MASGTLLLAALLLTMGQVPSDVSCKNTRNLRIPITMDPNKAANISQLLLFVSSDQGKNWHQEAVVPPDQVEFLFYAPADGLYWMRVAYVDKKGRQIPEDISKGPPNLKVLIDTLRPMVRIASAQRQGDEVTLAWEIQEEYPDATSLKVEYHSADAPAGQWTQVPASQKLIDQGHFRMSTSSPVVVKVEFRDLAGNVSYDQKEVPGPGGITAASFKANVADASLPPPPAPPNFPPDSTPDIKPPPQSDNKAIVPPSVDPVLPKEQTSLPAPPPPSVGSTPPPQPQEPQPKIVARSDTPRPSVPQVAPPTTATVAEPGPSALPTARLVNRKEAVLEYKLDKVGPSGIGSVDVYLTEDDGQTWKLWADEPEPKSLVAGGMYRRELPLPGEGVFGFRLVAKSRAGRARPAPRAGDHPELRVEVDTTKPEAELLEPQPDPSHNDALLLRWRVRDKNLDERSITLEYADQLDGKWEPIAVDQPNAEEGYSWKVPQGKVSVYLRLRVRDRAGNEAVATTSEPQLVDLTVPEAHLIENGLASPR